MASVYKAHPLNVDDSTNIRVIELVYGDVFTARTPISCRLRVVRLEDKPGYTALSYVWGPETDTKNIILDGKRFTIRRNLWDFLAHYRRNGEQSYLWIDALCIDQSSIEERNHQVAMMGQIYTKAKLAIAWLGYGFEIALQRVMEFKSLNKFASFESNIPILKAFARDLARLTISPYWDRLWIVQEFVLAQSLEIRSGTVRVDGHVLALLHASAMAYYRGWRPDPDAQESDSRMHAHFSTGGLCAAAIIFFCREARHGNPTLYKAPRGLDSRWLFDRFRFSKCSDARDRVYGLLGLIDPKELRKFPIHPNYEKSKSTLFLELWERQVYQHSLVDPRSISGSSGKQWYDRQIALMLKTQLELSKKDKNVALVLNKIEHTIEPTYTAPLEIESEPEFQPEFRRCGLLGPQKRFIRHHNRMPTAIY